MFSSRSQTVTGSVNQSPLIALAMWCWQSRVTISHLLLQHLLYSDKGHIFPTKIQKSMVWRVWMYLQEEYDKILEIKAILEYPRYTRSVWQLVIFCLVKREDQWDFQLNDLISSYSPRFFRPPGLESFPCLPDIHGRMFWNQVWAKGFPSF